MTVDRDRLLEVLLGTDEQAEVPPAVLPVSSGVPTIMPPQQSQGGGGMEGLMSLLQLIPWGKMFGSQSSSTSPGSQNVGPGSSTPYYDANSAGSIGSTGGASGSTPAYWY